MRRRLLNVTETAEFLNVKVSTIYNWVHYKRIPFVKLGGRLAFIEDQLLEFIESNTFRPEY